MATSTSSVPVVRRRDLPPIAAFFLTIGGNIVVIAIAALAVAAVAGAALAVFGGAVLESL